MKRRNVHVLAVRAHRHAVSAVHVRAVADRRRLRQRSCPRIPIEHGHRVCLKRSNVHVLAVGADCHAQNAVQVRGVGDRRRIRQRARPRVSIEYGDRRDIA